MLSRFSPLVIWISALALAACGDQIVLGEADEVARAAVASPTPPTVLRLCDERCGTAPEAPPDMASPPDLATTPDLAPPPPSDTDGDGVADSQDKCKLTPAGQKPDAKRAGCPADVITTVPVEGIVADVDAVAGYQAGGIDDYYAATLLSGRAYLDDAPAGDLRLGRLVVVADVALPPSDPRCAYIGDPTTVYSFVPKTTAGDLCVPSQVRALRVVDGASDLLATSLQLASGRLDRALPGFAQYFSIGAATKKLTVSAAVVGTVKLRGLKLAVEVTSRWSK